MSYVEIDGVPVVAGDRLEWGWKPTANGVYAYERVPLVDITIWPQTIARMAALHEEVQR